MQAKLVSIIIICYNHSKYLTKTLDSILNQTYKNLELIIIDANSTDNSPDLIREWIAQNNLDCKFIEQKIKCKVSENLNLGISQSTGEFIQLISTDDILLPRKIENQVKLLNENPENMLVFSNAYYIDHNGDFYLSGPRKTYSTYQEQEKLFKYSSLGIFSQKIREHCFIIPHSALIRREVYDRIGYYDEDLLIEDWDFFLRFFESGLTAVLDESIETCYRITPGSVWRSRNANLFREQMKIFVKHNLFSSESATVLYLSIFGKMIIKDRIYAFFKLVQLGQTKWAIVYIFNLFAFRRNLLNVTGRIKRKIEREILNVTCR